MRVSPTSTMSSGLISVLPCFKWFYEAAASFALAYEDDGMLRLLTLLDVFAASLL